MKRLLIGAVALTMLGGTAASAQPYHNDRHDERRVERHDDRRMERHDRGHHWARGQRLPSEYRSRNYYVSDYRRYHLRQPPRGYQWVRVDDNYMLVALTTGLISQIIASR